MSTGKLRVLLTLYFALLLSRVPLISAQRLLDTSDSLTNYSDYFLVFAATPSDPLKGITGHAFVVWGVHDWKLRQSKIEPYGFYLFSDTGADAWKAIIGEVPGGVMNELVVDSVQSYASFPNISDSLIVAVSKENFDKANRVVGRWRNHPYRLGVSDCVTFIQEVGNTINLPMPDRALTTLLPDAYIKALIDSVTPYAEAENDCCKFSGSLVNGLWHGRVVIVNKNGWRVFNGYYVANQKTYGWSRTSDFEYTGQFKNDLFDGYGKYLYHSPSGDITETFRGMFSKHEIVSGTLEKVDSRRRMTWKYEGPFVNYRPNGVGIMRYKGLS